MRGGILLRAALALMVGLSLVTIGTPAATAATTGRYRTQPAGATPALVDLGLSVTVAAGETQLVSSYLVVGSAGQLTAVSHLVYCRLAESTTVTERIISGRNVTPATTVTLLTRALVTAPETGDLTCTLYVILINHTSTRAYGTISVLAGTSLRTLSAPLITSAQTWQPNQALVNTSYAAAPVRFTPDEEASTIQAFGDVNVTVCYYGSTGTCLGAGSRRSTTRAYVGTQLVVNQLQSDGTVCSTFVNGPLLGTSITSTIHHYKVNTAITDIPVSSSCTSRTFLAYVRVTANAGSNSIIVEPSHQSQTSLYVRP